MPRKTEPPKPRPVGRPKTLPPNTRIRGKRLTDAEYEAVNRFVDSLRGDALESRIHNAHGR